LLTIILHRSTGSIRIATRVDFLLVQYSSIAPSRLEDADVDLEYVAQMWTRCWESELTLPEWLQRSTISLGRDACRSLNEFADQRHPGKRPKAQEFRRRRLLRAGRHGGIHRFSFLMRRVFFRLMHPGPEYHSGRVARAGRRAIATLDCRSAQFSADEPVPGCA